MDRDQLFLEIRKVLVDQFEVDGELVTPGASLYEELDIDSIDAVDLLVRLKELTGRKIAPEVFQEVRTINDVLDKLTSE